MTGASNTDFDGAKRKFPERGIYTPPSGKYSTTNTSNASSGNNIKRRTYSNGSNRGGAANGVGNGNGKRRF